MKCQNPQSNSSQVSTSSFASTNLKNRVVKGLSNSRSYPLKILLKLLRSQHYPLRSWSNSRSSPMIARMTCFQLTKQEARAPVCSAKEKNREMTDLAPKILEAHCMSIPICCLQGS